MKQFELVFLTDCCFGARLPKSPLRSSVSRLFQISVGKTIYIVSELMPKHCHRTTLITLLRQ